MHVSFAGWSWLLPMVLLTGVAALIIIWGYLAGPPGPLRWICALLKLLGIAAIAACLLEPLWTSQRARPGANFFAVVADNSQGMQIRDRGATRSRGEVLRDLLTSDKTTWQEKLDENFQVRRYVFDS